MLLAQLFLQSNRSLIDDVYGRQTLPLPMPWRPPHRSEVHGGGIKLAVTGKPNQPAWASQREEGGGCLPRWE